MFLIIGITFGICFLIMFVFYIIYLFVLESLNFSAKGIANLKQFKERLKMIKNVEAYIDNNDFLSRLIYKNHQTIIDHRFIKFNNNFMVLNFFNYICAQYLLHCKIKEIKKDNKLKLQKWEEIESKEIMNKLTEE